MLLLGYSIDRLKSEGAYITAKEISQQPRLWGETLGIIISQWERISAFQRELERVDVKRIILTGAGTSSFVGEIAAPYLSRILGRTIESIPTTDIVSKPENYLYRDVPTLLISFARSGNSPESVAAVALAKQLVNKLYQITITCNKNGELAKVAGGDKNNLMLIMPEDSNDQGFAMTGSFTSMLLSVLLIFEKGTLEEKSDLVRNLQRVAEETMECKLQIIKEISALDYERIAFLGSSELKGIAEEASLKVLELTGGKIPVVYNSPLGFRHGPKSIINDKTIVVIFLSSDKYTRQYELDILKEMKADDGDKKVVVISTEYDCTIETVCDYFMIMNSSIKLEDVYNGLDYIIAAQIFGFYKSLELNLSPDNPSPSGLVNRVVKGVNIYKYN